MSKLISKAEWLLSIASPTAHEEKLCEQLLEWASDNFVQPAIVRQRQGFRLHPGPAQAQLPNIALVGHLDTVPPAQQQRLGILDGRLYGCGASDMKAGVAVMMELLEEWQTFPCNLIGLFYDREEGPYADNGLEPLLAGLPEIDFAVVLEPTNNEIHAGCVGSLQARVHFHGQRAHSARPWQGDNAIYRAIPLLTRLAQRQRRSVHCQNLEFFEVITATQAVSPGPTNAVPEEFTLNLNSRFAPGRSSQQAIAELTELVAGEGELEIYDVAPCGVVQLEHPSLQRWIREAQLKVMPKQAWTDVARLGEHGIAAFNFGPGDPAQAHQADEYVNLDAIQLNHQHLKQLLKSMVGVPGH